MANVALNNSTMTQSEKSNHVTYTERYISGWGGGYPLPDGGYVPSYPIYSNATWYSNAKTSGYIKAESQVLVNGIPVAKQSDSTQEAWVAIPIPSPHYGGTITSISPGTSGSGNGTVGNSRSHVRIDGMSVALIGTSVTTHLGNMATIETGSDFVNIQ